MWSWHKLIVHSWSSTERWRGRHLCEQHQLCRDVRRRGWGIYPWKRKHSRGARNRWVLVDEGRSPCLEHHVTRWPGGLKKLSRWQGDQLDGADGWWGPEDDHQEGQWCQHKDDEGDHHVVIFELDLELCEKHFSWKIPSIFPLKGGGGKHHDRECSHLEGWHRDCLKGEVQQDRMN